MYGPHGNGKSTWGASWPGVLMLPTEDGLNDIDCNRTPLINTYGKFQEAMSFLCREDHEFNAACIDTLDWLEPLLWAHVCTQHGKASIEEFGYGKGYTFALAEWDRVIKALDFLREHKSMSIILLAHAKVVKFMDPESDGFDRYEPDLHKSVASRLMEWCDEVFFAGYRVATKKVEEGFNQTRMRGVSSERVVYTCEMPSHLAKRRVALPDVLPLNYDAYAAAMNGGNIAGVVVDGSSKRKPVKKGEPTK